MMKRPSSVSVTQPVSEAIEHTKTVLFRPFNLAKWFTIGFCAWLATLGEGGGCSFPSSPSGVNRGYERPWEDGPHEFEDAGEEVPPGFKRERNRVPREIREAKEFLEKNLSWIIPVGLIALVVIIGLIVLVTWLSSRGKFMFLHCVALNRAEVTAPWSRYIREGNSLFRFRLVLGLLGLFIALPLLGVAAYLLYGMMLQDEPAPEKILLLVCTGLAFFAATLLLGVTSFFTNEFVTPIMFLRRNRCLQAWGEFLVILKQNLWRFIGFLLFVIVLSIATGILVLVAILLTCCIAGCLIAIPYIGTVVLLPVLVFWRSYTAYYLAQYGLHYNVFLPPLAPINDDPDGGVSPPFIDPDPGPSGGKPAI